jgi:hypothetical protein
MKILHTSMRWIQQHLRYQAYLEERQKDVLQPTSSTVPRNQANQGITSTEAERPGSPSTLPAATISSQAADNA